MKKSIMKMILAIIGIITLINACQPENMRINEAEIQEKQIPAKAYLSVTLDGGRSVLPQALDKTALTWTLVGHYNNDDTQLGTWSYADMLAAKPELMLGQWDFTLTANDGEQNVLIGNINNCNVVLGDNQLSFTMREYDTGTGIISVTVRMPHEKIAKVEVVLRDDSDDTHIINTQLLSVNECTDDPLQDYASYGLNSVDKGLYSLLLRLYQDESDTQSINQQMVLVRVEPGCISAGTVTFEQVSSYWHIVYHFDGFDVTNDPVLQTKYNESMKIIMPTQYQADNGDNYYIIGSYNNDNRTGDNITEIDYDTSGDIELWVKAKKGVPIETSGLSAYLNTLTTSDEPYTIILTDKNPDLSDIKSVLTSHSSIKVNLDMEECTELTSISANALKDCTNLTGIIIPNSVTSIDQGAFSGCSGLESITIPFVGDQPHDASDDDQYPFGYIFGTSSYSGGTKTMQYITYYFIPASLKTVVITGSSYIPSRVFLNCSGLTSIAIPDSVTSIGQSAFSSCSGLTSINIPNSVTSIDDNTFYGCSGLTSVTIGNSVTSIGEKAFASCSSLTSIEIPASVTSIDKKAFYSCGGLTSINVDTNNAVYDSRNNCNAIIEKLTNTLIAGCKSTVIPNSVTSIGDWAFYNCKGLTSITIPNSVTNICGQAFYKCSNLMSINIPNGVTSIGVQAFEGCSSLESITIPSSVTSIDRYAFSSCSKLTSINIPNGVTSIEMCTFSGCSSLTSIEIPSSVTSIGESAFEGCSGLTSINIPDSVTSIGSSAFENCRSLTSIEIPSSVTSIGGYAFQSCSGLMSINIPNSVTSIGGSVFYSCNGLTSITIPFVGTQPLTPADDNQYPLGYMFATNTYNGGGTEITQKYYEDPNGSVTTSKYYISNSLKTVVVTGGSYILYGAFYNCSNLTSVTIPASVMSIESYAFYNCTSMTTLTVKATTPPELKSGALSGCSALTTIYVPTASVGAYQAADGWKDYTIADGGF